MSKRVWQILAILFVLLLMMFLVPSPLSMQDGLAELITYPIDQSGGIAINWKNYVSDTEYKDPSLHVQLFEGRIFDTDYMYAIIKIEDPTQLRTAACGDRFSNQQRAQGSLIAKDKNAIFAIDGDYFKYYTHGYLIRQGHVYRQRPSKLWDILILDQYGDFHIIQEPSTSKVEKWIKDNPKLSIINSFNFGPVLYLNGEPCKLLTMKESDADHDGNNYSSIGAHKKAQRIAFCQLDKLTYLAVTCDSPETKGQAGMLLSEFQQCLMEVDSIISKDFGYHIQTAYNLDGGSSATFVFKDPGKNALAKVNAKNYPRTPRAICDIIYFVSAWKE